MALQEMFFKGGFSSQYQRMTCTMCLFSVFGFVNNPYLLFVEKCNACVLSAKANITIIGGCHIKHTYTQVHSYYVGICTAGQSVNRSVLLYANE